LQSLLQALQLQDNKDQHNPQQRWFYMQVVLQSLLQALQQHQQQPLLEPLKTGITIHTLHDNNGELSSANKMKRTKQRLQQKQNVLQKLNNKYSQRLHKP
jgi:hypothetical protein